MLRLLILFALGGCMTGVVLATPHASIHVHPHVRASGPTVFLGDLAHLRSTDLALMQKLVNLPVARAPQPGQVLRIDRDTVLAKAQRSVDASAGHLEWTGAEQTDVARVATTVRGDAIASAAVAAARAGLLQQGADVEVAVVPRDIEVAAAHTRLQARAPAQGQVRGRMLAWVDVLAGDVVLRTVPVSLSVSREVSLHMRPSAAQASAGAKPVVATTEGQPAEPVAVNRGEWATLRTGTPGLVLESRVEVLQDGRPGQKVRVRQQGATGIVLGRVLGRGQLELAP